MTTPQDRLKQATGEQAAALVEDGMVVGLGTGSTAKFAIDALIQRVRDGLKIEAIATSERSAEQAREGGIKVVDFAVHQRVDLTIDGADEITRVGLNLIKGLGGALLREKIVAAASDRLVIIADASKLVDQLGEKTAVPIEIVRFGWQVTAAHIAALGATITLRQAGREPYLTDGGNLIVDAAFGVIADPAALDLQLNQIVGLVETGLFIGRARLALIADQDGVHQLNAR